MAQERKESHRITADSTLKKAATEAIEAFGSLCDAGTDILEYLLEELKEDRAK